MSRRVFLLGLDGASWNLLDRLFAAEVMPNLQRLCRQGVRATLESTVPPITPVAWTTLMTGANPGKHGIFGFLKDAGPDTYLQVPINRLDVQVPTIFDYMREGGRLISLNLPMSYPASAINGLMITGMMTPLRSLDHAQYPDGLLSRLANAGIDYTIDPKFELGKDVPPTELMTGWQESGGKFVRDLARITGNRMRAVQALMSEEEWQVFICVVVGTDRLQHLFWNQLMQGETDDIDPILSSYYTELDGHIGELAGRLRRDDSLLIVSDHGFTACHGAFYANEWLKRNGWLAPSQSGISPLVRLKNLVKRFGISSRTFRGILGDKKLGRLQLMAGDIDRKRTSAYFGASNGIRLNVRGREVQGVVAPEEYEDLRQRVMGRLRELKDEQGRSVIAEVFRREDLFSGSAAAQSPDIIFLFREEALYGAYASDLGKGLFADTPFKTGDHRIDGIFVAWGGGIRGGQDGLRFHIQDILPTVMHLCGRSVPAVCDGRVLEEILSAQDPVELEHEWQRYLGQRREMFYDADQQAEIKERLRALGYMSDDN